MEGEIVCESLKWLIRLVPWFSPLAVFRPRSHRNEVPHSHMPLDSIQATITLSVDLENFFLSFTTWKVSRQRIYQRKLHSTNASMHACSPNCVAPSRRLAGLEISLFFRCNSSLHAFMFLPLSFEPPIAYPLWRLLVFTRFDICGIRTWPSSSSPLSS